MKRNRRPRLQIALLGALTLTSLLVGSASAYAGESPVQTTSASTGTTEQLYQQSVPMGSSAAAVVACPKSAFCAYSDRSYGGIMQAFYGSNPNWDAWPALRNKDSSWANNSSTKSVKLFPNRDYKGSFMCFLPGTKDSDAWLEDDNTESNKFVPQVECF